MAADQLKRGLIAAPSDRFAVIHPARVFGLDDEGFKKGKGSVINSPLQVLLETLRF
jgi:hypothetical protein